MKLGLGRFVPILGRLVPVFWALLPALAGIIPRFVSFWLNRTLGGWKSKGLIENYGTRTVRSGRQRYEVEICIVLTTEQAGDRLHELLAKAMG